MVVISKFNAGLVILAVAGLIALFAVEKRANGKLRAETERQTAISDAKLGDLRKQVAVETKRVAVAEERVSALLREAQALPKTPPARKPGDVLKAVTERANQLIAQQKYAEATAEYVKGYTELRGITESQSVMAALANLGRRSYPAALTALAGLRDTAMKDWRDDPKRDGLPFEIALLNDRLGEGEKTIPVYDALAPSDSARSGLAMIAMKSFVKARRYSDALLGRRFSQMMLMAESAARNSANVEPQYQEARRKSILDNISTDIEIITGAGKADEAKQLEEKWLSFDNSDIVRTTIEQARARALAPH